MTSRTLLAVLAAVSLFSTLAITGCAETTSGNSATTPKSQQQNPQAPRERFER